MQQIISSLVSLSWNPLTYSEIGKMLALIDYLLPPTLYSQPNSCIRSYKSNSLLNIFLLSELWDSINQTQSESLRFFSFSLLSKVVLLVHQRTQLSVIFRKTSSPGISRTAFHILVLRVCWCSDFKMLSSSPKWWVFLLNEHMCALEPEVVSDRTNCLFFLSRGMRIWNSKTFFFLANNLRYLMYVCLFCFVSFRLYYKLYHLQLRSSLCFKSRTCQDRQLRWRAGAAHHR